MSNSRSSSGRQSLRLAGLDAIMRVLYWFRTDLRLHDSPALTAALALGTPAAPIEAFYPVRLSFHRDTAY